MEDISDDEKVRIASDFIMAAPPGEFKEVVNDVRILLGDDKLLSRASSVFQDYAKEQFTTVKVDGEECLITPAASVGKAFIDPKHSKSFTYNYLTTAVSEVEEVARDATAERWRAAVESELKVYLDEVFPDHVSGVYGSFDGENIKLTVCIEDHKYNPNNFWNGKWKSNFSVNFPTDGGASKVVGELKVQVHYYEDGNVQLLSNKQVEEDVQITGPTESARNIVECIKKAETEYQMAINENYRTMSDTTFKALRRNLPITHSLIDWHKLHGLQVGKDIMNR